MATVLFDTLRAFESLKSAGFTESQAKGLSEALKSTQESSIEGLATKSDIAAVKSDIAAVKSELSERITKIEAEFVLIKWMLGFLVAGVISLIVKAFFVH